MCGNAQGGNDTQVHVCVSVCTKKGGFFGGCIQQLLLRQLLMSERQQLAGLPEDPHPGWK